MNPEKKTVRMRMSLQNLKIFVSSSIFRFYIQVKKHEGETDSWAVQQISEYKKQKQNEDGDYTYLSWVISTASFNETAVQNAKESGVRLIGGNDFIRMLIDCGLGGIELSMI